MGFYCALAALISLALMYSETRP